MLGVLVLTAGRSALSAGPAPAPHSADEAVAVSVGDA